MVIWAQKILVATLRVLVKDYGMNGKTESGQMKLSLGMNS